MFIILGAGISGLTLGHALKKNNKEFLILEKSDRTGGWIKTDSSQGFLFEHGPRSFRTIAAGSPTLELVDELNLRGELIVADPSAKKRLLYHKGNVRAFKPWNSDILKGIWKDITTGSSSKDDESVEEFFSRRFGNEISHCFGDAVVSGIFAGDFTQLSMKSCFPKFWEWDQKHRGMVRGMLKNRGKKTAIYSFKNGLQTLTDRLTEELKDHIRLNCEVTSLEQNDHSITVTMADYQQISAEKVFATISPHQLASLVPQPLAKQLESIPAASVAVVHFGFKKNILLQKGFGYLVPHREKQPIIGVVWDSCTFPQHNKYPEETRLTVMIGGSRQAELVNQDAKSLQELAYNTLVKHLNISAMPDVVSLSVARNAIPQYVKGHEIKLRCIEESIEEMLPDLTLLGSGYNGVSVNDCILQARRIGGYHGIYSFSQTGDSALHHSIDV